MISEIALAAGRNKELNRFKHYEQESKGSGLGERNHP
jgi:hypothetical protein